MPPTSPIKSLASNVVEVVAKLILVHINCLKLILCWFWSLRVIESLSFRAQILVELKRWTYKSMLGNFSNKFPKIDVCNIVDLCPFYWYGIFETTDQLEAYQIVVGL